MNSTVWQTLGSSLVLSSLIWTAAFEGTSRLAQATSAAEPTQLAQTSSVDVSALRSHLQAQDWQAADQETRRILQSYVHRDNDIFGSPLPTLIPAEVMQTLDQLWSEASDGKFGFSVQAKIWEELRSQTPDDTNIVTKAFGDRVGWTRRVPDENYIFSSPDWLTEPELTYSLEAPVGHLPWAGIDWSVIEGMLTAQSCGSCTTDVLYLQGDRFSRYLPTLFNWAQTALESPVPRVGSWAQAQLVRQIDLKSLYPDSACPVAESASAISPDGSVIAIGSYSYERSCATPGESALALWNAQSGNQIITLHRGPALAASSQGNPPQEPTTEGHRIVGDVANAVAFTPDSQFVAAGMSYGVIRLWRTGTDEQVRIFEGHDYAVRAIAISSDGQTLVSASADQTIKLWNLKTGALLRTIPVEATDGIVQTLLISADGQRLATVTNRNTVQLWDAQTGQLIRTLANQANQRATIPLAFSPDGQTLATADTDHSVKLWRANSGARIITLKGHTQPLLGLAFSPDGQRLASSDGKTGQLWNLATYQTVHSFDLDQSIGHPVQPDNLGQVAFSPDGKTLATSTLLLPLVQSEPIPQQSITLWDVATGAPLQQIHEVTQFQFSPDGQFLLANGQTVQLWEPYSSLVDRNLLP
ncbi:MAG: GUN4 domain-containing protein [Phormidesmis sp.]